MSLTNMSGKFTVKGGSGGGISSPSTPSITNKTSSGFTVSWSAVDNAIGYRLDISTDSGFSSFVSGYNSKSVSGTSEVVTGLTSNTTYYTRVRAVAASSNSGSVSDTTQTSTLLNAGLLNGLQAFYKLDDETDASGNVNALTNYGASFTSGKIGNCASLNGTHLSKTPWNIGQTFSISFWANVASLSNYEFLVTQYGGMCVYTKTDGALEFGDGASWNATTSSNIIQPNTWHHCVLVSNNGYGTLYVDNVNAASNNTNMLDLNDTNDRQFGLGTDGQSGGNNVAKLIDAVGVWNRILTEQEVSELYNSGSGLE